MVDHFQWDSAGEGLQGARGDYKKHSCIIDSGRGSHSSLGGSVSMGPQMGRLMTKGSKKPRGTAALGTQLSNA